MLRRSHLLCAVSLLASSLTLIVCGGGSDSPAASTPTPATTMAAAAPSPSPVPTPRSLIFSACNRLPPGNPNNRCARTNPAYLTQVDAAIDKAIAEHPEVFDLNDTLGGGIFRVTKPGAYHLAVLENLNAAGLCVEKDADEIAVKDTNDSHDQYQILVSSGFLRRGLGAYRATCFPAGFPTPPPVLGQMAGCSVPESRDLGCGREDNPVYYEDVQSAIAQVISEKPELFDFRDVLPGTDWMRILDQPAYNKAIVAILSAKGYCAVGHEELGVKRTNGFNENYKITASPSHVRRGPGSYRSTCYPAAF